MASFLALANSSFLAASAWAGANTLSKALPDVALAALILFSSIIVKSGMFAENGPLADSGRFGGELC